MDSISFRITREYATLKETIEGLEAERILVYQHNADEDISRTHVHGLIEGCPISVLAFKNRLKKAVGTISKSDWAFKATDGNSRYITYMSKGYLEPEYSRGLHQQFLDECKGAWMDIEKTIKLKKPTYDDIVFMTMESLGEEPVVSDFSLALVQVLNKYKVVCGRNKYRDMLDTIQRLTYPVKTAWDMVHFYEQGLTRY